MYLPKQTTLFEQLLKDFAFQIQSRTLMQWLLKVVESNEKVQGKLGLGLTPCNISAGPDRDNCLRKLVDTEERKLKKAMDEGNVKYDK